MLIGGDIFVSGVMWAFGIYINDGKDMGYWVERRSWKGLFVEKG